MGTPMEEDIDTPHARSVGSEAMHSTCKSIFNGNPTSSLFVWMDNPEMNEQKRNEKDYPAGSSTLDTVHPGFFFSLSHHPHQLYTSDRIIWKHGCAYRQTKVQSENVQTMCEHLYLIVLLPMDQFYPIPNNLVK